MLLTTKLALERTRGAYERTLMAWVRTGTSLITFGFAVYKFFQIEMSSTNYKPPLVGSREFGMVLISIGLISVLLGTYEHRRDLRAIREHYPDMPRSMSTVIAMLLAPLGILALVAVVYRF